ncbi:GNAT family N-acetyltransferase [Sedimentitalea sp. HM32M-2]|uniref:GNAT family N-acetyltransferase n=1 Tax=Sedimentitalea sp. HM32M-2 TaxID=3351566 RepID=UPI00363A88A4
MSIALRAARPLDAGATGDILWRFQDRTDWIPALYSAAQTIAFCGQMIDRGWVTVATENGRVQGFLARDGQEICGLYLDEAARGRGIGWLLLRDAQRHARRLRLRSFAANGRARDFYRRAGFVPVAHGDGRDNDENLPDIAYVWHKEVAA